jgi:hypothetical protein
MGLSRCLSAPGVVAVPPFVCSVGKRAILPAMSTKAAVVVAMLIAVAPSGCGGSRTDSVEAAVGAFRAEGLNLARVARVGVVPPEQPAPTTPRPRCFPGTLCGSSEISFPLYTATTPRPLATLWSRDSSEVNVVLVFVYRTTKDAKAVEGLYSPSSAPLRRRNLLVSYLLLDPTPGWLAQVRRAVRRL